MKSQRVVSRTGTILLRGTEYMSPALFDKANLKVEIDDLDVEHPEEIVVVFSDESHITAERLTPVAVSLRMKGKSERAYQRSAYAHSNAR